MSNPVSLLLDTLARLANSCQAVLWANRQDREGGAFAESEELRKRAIDTHTAVLNSVLELPDSKSIQNHAAEVLAFLRQNGADRDRAEKATRDAADLANGCFWAVVNGKWKDPEAYGLSAGSHFLSCMRAARELQTIAAGCGLSVSVPAFRAVSEPREREEFAASQAISLDRTTCTDLLQKIEAVKKAIYVRLLGYSGTEHESWKQIQVLDWQPLNETAIAIIKAHDDHDALRIDISEFIRFQRQVFRLLRKAAPTGNYEPSETELQTLADQWSHNGGDADLNRLKDQLTRISGEQTARPAQQQTPQIPKAMLADKSLLEWLLDYADGLLRREFTKEQLETSQGQQQVKNQLMAAMHQELARRKPKTPGLVPAPKPSGDQAQWFESVVWPHVQRMVNTRLETEATTKVSPTKGISTISTDVPDYVRNDAYWREPFTVEHLINVLRVYEEIRARQSTPERQQACPTESAEAAARKEDYRDIDRLSTVLANAPGKDRTRLLCDELTNSDGMTAANVVKLRAKVCRAKPCMLEEANALTLDEMADVLEASPTAATEQGEGGKPPAENSHSDATNFVRLSGEIWHLGYNGEVADFAKKDNKFIGWLVKLLSKPGYSGTERKNGASFERLRSASQKRRRERSSLFSSSTPF